MDGRVRGVAGFLLVLWCLAVSQAQIIPGTRQVRMETGSVRMSALPAYSPPTGGPAGTVEEEAPSHASGPEFSVPASIQSRQLATITTAAALSTAAATASFNTLSSPAPNLSFVAQTMSSNYPPDTNGAVGPNHLVTTTNDQIVVQDRSGHVLTNTALNTFWQSTWPDVNPAWDPNIRYDPYADRWIFACMGNYGGVGSSLLLA
ncbi:MAG TPA: hypothetical protein VE734_13090, partial [Terriglobales bacterium]|nr:hypothetical protein [Terriglobales bacterium]